MAELRYTIVSTEPTVYQDATRAIVNGVLIRFTLTDYNETHEVRLPKLDAALAQVEIAKVLTQRDMLEGSTPIKSK